MVASVDAAQQRGDLESLGIGRTDVAFKMRVPDIFGRRFFTILADGVRLTPEPMVAGPGVFDGNAILGHGVITGWVIERVSSCLPPLITVIDQDGRSLGETQSALSSEDIDESFRPARFALEIPARVLRGQDAAAVGAGQRRRLRQL